MAPAPYFFFCPNFPVTYQMLARCRVCVKCLASAIPTPCAWCLSACPCKSCWPIPRAARCVLFSSSSSSSAFGVDPRRYRVFICLVKYLHLTGRGSRRGVLRWHARAEQRQHRQLHHPQVHATRKKKEQIEGTATRSGKTAGRTTGKRLGNNQCRLSCSFPVLLRVLLFLFLLFFLSSLSLSLSLCLSLSLSRAARARWRRAHGASWP